mmetsp:Transcript_1745/g.2817  ORF Transcript_1745/g.2817 Transcript_1745/m.2817 type:complete len:120 (-) Transcript_1745:147-506(-)
MRLHKYSISSGCGISVLLSNWPEAIQDKDRYGRTTPLHIACMHRVGVVSLLLSSFGQKSHIRERKKTLVERLFTRHFIMDHQKNVNTLFSHVSTLYSDDETNNNSSMIIDILNFFIHIE